MSAPKPIKGSDAWRYRPGVRAVVLDDSGRIMLLLRPDNEELFGGYWNLPGGGLDPGETFLQGASRELQEETGITATPTGAMMPFTFPGGHGKAYLYRNPQGALVVAERETVEVRWVYPSELSNLKLMPPTLEIVRGLVGTGDRPMKELDLTAPRLAIESWAGTAIESWLKAHVEAIAREKGLLIKSLGGTDEEGAQAMLRVLVRARKLGAQEAARAILYDARHGKLPEGRSKGYQDATRERLFGLAQQNVAMVRQTTERRLADIAAHAEALDVNTMVQKLYDMARSDLIGLDLVAKGYMHGVADVLKQHGYTHVYARTMGDDKVCTSCQAWNGMRMTLGGFLKRFPLHPRCRCYPFTSPVAPPTPLNWRAKQSVRITKGLIAMATTPGFEALRSLVETPEGEALIKGLGKADPEKLREVAKKRNRDHGRFASGKVTADEPTPEKPPAEQPAPEKPKGESKAPPVPKRPAQSGKPVLASKPAKPAPPAGPQPAKTAADPAAPAKPAGPPASPSGAPAPGTKSPQHLIHAANGMLEQIRTMQPGTPDHKHLVTQYEALRQNIKGWNASNGESASKPEVAVPKPPAFVKGKLESPRQYELAAAQATTREDAIELGHHFDANTRKNGNQGPEWDTAWSEIKAKIAGLPGKDGNPSDMAASTHATEGAKAAAKAGQPIAAQRLQDRDAQRGVTGEDTSSMGAAHTEAKPKKAAASPPAPPPSAPPPAADKAPHEMTPEEFKASKHYGARSGPAGIQHMRHIERAIGDGQNVPDHVLDAYGGHGRGLVGEQANPSPAPATDDADYAGEAQAARHEEAPPEAPADEPVKVRDATEREPGEAIPEPAQQPAAAAVEELKTVTQDTEKHPLDQQEGESDDDAVKRMQGPDARAAVASWARDEQYKDKPYPAPKDPIERDYSEAPEPGSLQAIVMAKGQQDFDKAHGIKRPKSFYEKMAGKPTRKLADPTTDAGKLKRAKQITDLQAAAQKHGIHVSDDEREKLESGDDATHHAIADSVDAAKEAKRKPPEQEDPEAPTETPAEEPAHPPEPEPDKDPEEPPAPPEEPKKPAPKEPKSEKKPGAKAGKHGDHAARMAHGLVNLAKQIIAEPQQEHLK